jgi:hypothetical protein
MPPYVVALIFSGLASIEAWSIRKAYLSGAIDGPNYHYRFNDNPLGFAAAIFLRVGIIAFAGAEIAYACGLIGNPIVAIQHALPFLPTQTRSYGA